jgi:hypothetical protein
MLSEAEVLAVLVTVSLPQPVQSYKGPLSDIPTTLL